MTKFAQKKKLDQLRAMFSTKKKIPFPQISQQQKNNERKKQKKIKFLQKNSKTAY